MDSLIGHRVRHSSYGLGTIVSVDDKGEHIGVRFGCGLKLVSSALLRPQLSQIMRECGPDAVVHKGYRLTAEIGESQGVWYGRVIIENLPDQRAPYRGEFCVTTPPNATREQVMAACFERGYGVVEINIPEATRHLSSPEPAGVLSQRDMIRYLVSTCGRNRDAVCQEYARAERRGKVERRGNRLDLSPQAYAYALWNDGLRKGWF